MLKKTMTYETFDGTTVTEDFYFNLSKAELVELEIATPGGFTEMLTTIVKAKNGEEIVKVFKKVILMSVGLKSPDGKKFMKSQQIRDEFEGTGAYSDLFVALATNAEEGAQFVNGIMPSGVVAEAKAEAAKVQGETAQEDRLAVTTEKVTEVHLPSSDKPAWQRERRDPTPLELEAMGLDEMRLAVQIKQTGVWPE
jgi:hypothetical protein